MGLLSRITSLTSHQPEPPSLEKRLWALTGSMALVLSKEGKCERKELETMMRLRAGHGEATNLLDALLQTGYLEEYEEGQVKLGWRARAELDLQSLMMVHDQSPAPATPPRRLAVRVDNTLVNCSACNQVLGLSWTRVKRARAGHGIIVDCPGCRNRNAVSYDSLKRNLLWITFYDPSNVRKREGESGESVPASQRILGKSTESRLMSLEVLVLTSGGLTMELLQVLGRSSLMFEFLFVLGTLSFLAGFGLYLEKRLSKDLPSSPHVGVPMLHMR